MKNKKMENKKIVKQYLNKHFKNDYLTENDLEYKALVRILNKKDKQKALCLCGNSNNKI